MWGDPKNSSICLSCGQVDGFNWNDDLQLICNCNLHLRFSYNINNLCINIGLRHLFNVGKHSNVRFFSRPSHQYCEQFLGFISYHKLIILLTICRSMNQFVHLQCLRLWKNWLCSKKRGVFLIQDLLMGANAFADDVFFMVNQFVFNPSWQLWWMNLWILLLFFVLLLFEVFFLQTR